MTGLPTAVDARLARRGARRAVALGVATVLVALAALGGTTTASADTSDPWWTASDAGGYRKLITVAGNGTQRTDIPVDVAFDPQLDGFSASSLRVVEVNASGAVVDDDVPVQYDASPTSRLVFLAEGATGAGQTRRFYAYYDTAAGGIPAKPVANPPVQRLSDVFDVDDDAIRVRTTAGTWFYQRYGAAFSSFDSAGGDWINYGLGKPLEFRGIPNSGFDLFHPGFKTGNQGRRTVDTQVVAQGPLKVSIRSTLFTPHPLTGGTWVVRHDIYPTHVVSTVETAPVDRPYWWLYEGTPGGSIDYASQVMRPDGTITGLGTSWEGDLPGEEWAGFTGAGRTFWMSKPQDDTLTDSYFLLFDPVDQNRMTVFGFGRDKSFSSETSDGALLRGPNTFVMGLTASTQFATVQSDVREVSRPLTTQVGPRETKPAPTTAPPTTQPSTTQPSTTAPPTTQPSTVGPTTAPTTQPGGVSQVPTGASRFVPLPAPVRFLDTRSGPRPAPNSVTDLQVTGRAGIPAEATAVVMNVTATETEGAGFVTAYPAGSPRPTASNLNPERPGQTLANLVTARLGAGGRVSLSTMSGAHLIVDVAGYYLDTPLPVAAGRFVPLPQPVRLLDTRSGAKPAANSVKNVTVAGQGGGSLVPAPGASAVVLNVTAVAPEGAGYVTVFPSGQPLPTASNVNFVAGQVVPNQVIVPIGAGGAISLYAFAATHLVVDVAGWFTDSSQGVSTQGLFVPKSPFRHLDTRLGGGPTPGAGAVRSVPVRGVDGIPATGVAAVVANVTATEAGAPGYVTAYPSGEVPVASNLNVERSGQTIANHVIARVEPADGAFRLFTFGPSHLVADVAGWYTA